MKELFVWVVSRPCHVSGYVGLFFWCFLWHDAGENHQVHDTFKLNGTTNMAKRAQPSSAEEYKRILQERQLLTWSLASADAFSIFFSFFFFNDM